MRGLIFISKFKLYTIGGGNPLDKKMRAVFSHFLERKKRMMIITQAQASFNQHNEYQSFMSKFGIEVCYDDYNNFSSFDYVYLLGGSTEALYQHLKEIDFADLVAENMHIIYIGISAGAIVFFDAGYGDANVIHYKGEYHSFALTKGLGLIEGYFCPHYQKPGIESFFDEVVNDKQNGYCLEDYGCCLFENGVKLLTGNGFKIKKGLYLEVIDQHKGEKE